MTIRRLLSRGTMILVIIVLSVGGVGYWRSTNVCEAGPLPAPRNPMRGTPYVMRLQTGLRKPGDIRTGVDFAGVVEAVGPGVTQFAPGDEVFGGRNGAFSDYLTIGADRALVRKPANITFEQAATVPIAGVTALQGLRDKGRIGRGMKVLINGASGGVGPADHTVIGPFGRVLAAYAMRPFVSQEMGMFMAALNTRDLTILAELLASGAITPVIDRRYPFEQAPAAIAYLEQGRARGKVVLAFD